MTTETHLLPLGMFSLKTCSVDGCHHYICADENTCYHHSNDKETILAQAQGQLGGKEDLFDLSVSEAHFCGLTLAPNRCNQEIKVET